MSVSKEAVISCKERAETNKRSTSGKVILVVVVDIIAWLTHYVGFTLQI